VTTPLSIPTRLSLSGVVPLTAGSADTQTFTADYTAAFAAAWPSVDAGGAETAFVYLRNTSAGTCEITAQKAGDSETTGPVYALDPGAAGAAGGVTLWLGPVTRAEAAAMQWRFSAAGTAVAQFHFVVDEGGPAS
jgi:hypothetical protein